MDGSQYSVPVQHLGATVGVRVHAEPVVIWRDADKTAEHPRPEDGGHRRIVEPSHFAPLFERNPRAQGMLYRQALLDLGPTTYAYVSELSHRQHAHLNDWIRCQSMPVSTPVVPRMRNGRYGDPFRRQ